MNGGWIWLARGHRSIKGPGRSSREQGWVERDSRAGGGIGAARGDQVRKDMEDEGKREQEAEGQKKSATGAPLLQ